MTDIICPHELSLPGVHVQANGITKSHANTQPLRPILHRSRPASSRSARTSRRALSLLLQLRVLSANSGSPRSTALPNGLPAAQGLPERVVPRWRATFQRDSVTVRMRMHRICSFSGLSALFSAVGTSTHMQHAAHVNALRIRPIRICVRAPQLLTPSLYHHDTATRAHRNTFEIEKRVKLLFKNLSRSRSLAFSLFWLPLPLSLARSLSCYTTKGSLSTQHHTLHIARVGVACRVARVAIIYNI